MASGDTLADIQPTGSDQSGTPATFDTRNGQTVLDFDASSNEDATFKRIMPAHYDGGGLTVTTHWAMSSATSGDIDVDVQLERQTGLDIDGDSFAAANSTDNTTVPGTAGQEFTVDVTFTDGADMDSVVAGDLYRIRITRDAVSDTASGDAELLGVEVKET